MWACELHNIASKISTFVVPDCLLFMKLYLEKWNGTSTCNHQILISHLKFLSDKRWIRIAFLSAPANEMMMMISLDWIGMIYHATSTSFIIHIMSKLWTLQQQQQQHQQLNSSHLLFQFHEKGESIKKKYDKCNQNCKQTWGKNSVFKLKTSKW